MLTASVAALLIVSPVQAQESNSAWNGVYAGVHAGYGGGDTDSSCTFLNPNICTALGSYETEGGFGGGQIGYNWNLAGFLIGVEGDVSFADIDGDSIFGGKTPSSDLDWMATLRARAGALVTPDILVYGTGGVAWGDWTDKFDPLGATLSWSNTSVGYTVGGGVEAKITDTISLKAEYLYMDFGDETNLFADGFGGYGTAKFDHELHTVRLGLNFQLF